MEKKETTKGEGFSMDRERKLVRAMDIKKGDSGSTGENDELNRSPSNFHLLMGRKCWNMLLKPKVKQYLYGILLIH